MPIDSDESDDETRRAFRMHLERLAAQVRHLARQLPAERDGSLIRIVQPGTRRCSVVPYGIEQLLEGALDLARRGLRVFPVAAATHNVADRTSGKVPLIAGWPARATTSEAQIRAWWSEEFVGANIGIATGSGSGLTVVDLDHRLDEGRNGIGELLALEEQHGPVPDGPVVERGPSLHIYFKHTPAVRSINGVLPGVDLKSDGGYVVAPPSFHRSGDRYRWREGTRDCPLPAMPAWLVAVLMPKPKLSRRRRRPDASPDGAASAIATIAQSISIDDVLDAYGFDATPCVCPLHEGADNPTAFNSYADGRRWHCFTNCPDGQSDGDTLDLIRRLSNCTLDVALAIATRIVAGEPVDLDAHERGAP